MDPISLALSGIGLGLQIFGGIGAAKTAKQVAAVSQNMAKNEQAINEQKNRQMEIEGRRMQLENLRNSQRARAMATNAAVTQGADKGSGLFGGLAQIQAQTLFNMEGVNQGLEIGRNIYGYNNSISQDKMKLAQLGADNATNQGLMSLGGALMKSGPVIGQFAQGFGGGGGKIGTFSNGGNYGEQPTWS